MIILYGALIFASVWFGVTLAKRLSERAKIYEDLLAFLSAFESNLMFKQDNFSDLVKLQVQDSDFKFIISEIIDNPNTTPIVEYLSPKELCEIKEMILSLSAGGIDSEIVTIGHLKTIAAKRLELATKQRNSFSSMSIKISLLVGILLVILLI